MAWREDMRRDATGAQFGACGRLALGHPPSPAWTGYWQRHRDMVMLTNLRASQPGDIAFRLVRAGAILAIGFPMIDPLHFKARMKIVPGSRFVGMDNAGSGDATTNDWDSFGLMLHHCRHGRAAPLAHHHDATALAALVLASTPINASEPIIF
jgi:hypothetical protein